MDTRPLRLDRTDAWAIHDCLQAQLAGFSGRHESAKPWHGLSLLAKLRPMLLEFEQTGSAKGLSVELTEGELVCIDLNVPRTAYQGATALLLRVFHALEELAYNLPLSEVTGPDFSATHRATLATWDQQDAGPDSLPTL